MKRIFTLLAATLLTFQGFSQNWLLTGNSGTTPPTNFLGTTDAVRLVFGTNNTERMTISSAGNVGIGTTTPGLPLSISNGTVDNFVRLTGSGPSVQFIGGTSNFDHLGKLAFATGTAQYVSTSVSGDFILQNLDSAGSLIFGTNFMPGNGLERMRINHIGYVGIATTSPTAKFHIDCSAVSGQSNPSNVRLQNLQSGSGTVLVIDDDGYVYKSASGTTASVKSGLLTTDLESQVEDLKAQVQELRSLLSSRLSLTQSQMNSLRAESAAWLGDNQPNPAINSTLIEYSLPEGVSSATCQVYSLDGKNVSTSVLNPTAGKNQLQLATGKLPSGLYIYSLIVNGKVVDTKKLAITR